MLRKKSKSPDQDYLYPLSLIKPVVRRGESAQAQYHVIQITDTEFKTVGSGLDYEGAKAVQRFHPGSSIMFSGWALLPDEDYHPVNMALVAMLALVIPISAVFVAYFKYYGTNQAGYEQPVKREASFNTKVLSC